MKTVIRRRGTRSPRSLIARLAAVLVVAVLGVSCGAAEPDALAVRDRSISRDGLNELVLAVNLIEPGSEDAPVSIDANQVRSVGSVWLQLSAAAEYLETQGVVFDSAAQEEAKIAVEQQISEGRLAQIDRDTEAYDALLLSVWLASQDERLTQADAGDAMRGYLDDAHVDSRLGEYDPELGQIQLG